MAVRALIRELLGREMTNGRVSRHRTERLNGIRTPDGPMKEQINQEKTNGRMPNCRGDQLEIR